MDKYKVQFEFELEEENLEAATQAANEIAEEFNKYYFKAKEFTPLVPTHIKEVYWLCGECTITTARFWN